VVDHAARGTAPKDFLVVPQKYRGRRVEELFQLSVVGHPPARLELYFADPEEERSQPATVALTCGGTVVCDDVSRVENQISRTSLGPLGPWKGSSSSRLSRSPP
jgi:hypothetical protein